MSDPSRTLARSLTVIEQHGRDRRLPLVADLVEQHQVGLIVIGHPVHVGGEAGAQAGYVEAYAQALARELEKRHLLAEIVLWDERYTTLEAAEIMQERSAAKGKRQSVDAVAAAVILQDYLDHQARDRQAKGTNASA